MNQTIIHLLQEYHQKNSCRMHMPGHKQKLFPHEIWREIYPLDVTEIDGFDDLFAPEGILKDAMARAADLWGARESFFLPGSTTAGILAGIAAALKRPGQSILIARNCHKSVYHACEWMQARDHFLLPEWDRERGIFLSVTPESVREALDTHPEIALAVITSPTYEGVISDVAGIAKICHERNIPLLVDEAHGAHLELHGIFPGGAVKAGADLVIQSLHKTLPALTQTGIAHLCSERIDKGEFARRLEMIQSSSPSYLLMASMDSCVELMQNQGEEILQNWRDAVDELRVKLQTLKHIRLAEGTNAGIFGFDPTKLTLRSFSAGRELARQLACRNVIAEMSLGQNVVLYTGAGTDREDCRRLWEALREIDGTLSDSPQPDSLPYCAAIPPKLLSTAEALSSEIRRIPLSEAEGEISGEYLWAYPPGIPVICPGERIGADQIRLLRRLQKGKLISSARSPMGEIAVLSTDSAPR